MKFELKKKLLKFFMDFNNEIQEECLCDDEPYKEDGSPNPACGFEWLTDKLSEINELISIIEEEPAEQ